MFVLNVPENFFYEIFECDDTGCTSVFVYNDCNAFFCCMSDFISF